MKETQWEHAVEQTATLYGWLWYHAPDNIPRGPENRKQRVVKGFPDLVLVKRDRLIFAELKTTKGRISPDQRTWLRALLIARQEVALWRPGDMDSVVRCLGPRGERPVLPVTLLEQLGISLPS